MRRFIGRSIGLGIFFVLVTSFGYGQARDVTQQMISTASCPSLVKAKYVPGARFELITPKAADSKETPQWPLHLDIAPVSGKFVVQARITVHGMSAKGGVIPAEAQHSYQAPWLNQTFVLPMVLADSAMARGTVWLKGYGAVQSVRLDWVRFNDGTSWTAPADTPCYASQTATQITSNQPPKSN